MNKKLKTILFLCAAAIGAVITLKLIEYAWVAVAFGFDHVNATGEISKKLKHGMCSVYYEESCRGQSGFLEQNGDANSFDKLIIEAHGFMVPALAIWISGCDRRLYTGKVFAALAIHNGAVFMKYAEFPNTYFTNVQDKKGLNEVKYARFLFPILSIPGLEPKYYKWFLNYLWLPVSREEYEKQAKAGDEVSLNGLIYYEDFAVLGGSVMLKGLWNESVKEIYDTHWQQMEQRNREAEKRNKKPGSPNDIIPSAPEQ